MSKKETNQLLINYMKKEEIKKAKERLDNNVDKAEILRLANKEYITEDEIKEALGFDDIEELTSETTNDKMQEEVIYKIDEDEESAEIKSGNQIVLLNDSQLEDYPNQPFNLYDEDKKKEMIESIKLNGIMQPLIVRKMANGKYQILAGHNRRNCGRIAGLYNYPCIIKENLSDDEAKIYLIDTNLCTREKISTMERARAYRMKYEIYKNQNIKPSMFEEVKKDNIGMARAAMIKEEKTSNGTIQRFLRLTYLIPSLQECVEKGDIGINTGEKLSFLPNEEQKFVYEIIKENIKITDNIAQKIKKESERYKREDKENFLFKEEMLELINAKKKIEENKNEFIMIPFHLSEIDRYFGTINDIDEVKRKIIYSLEETYIKLS